jgi:hypothetical protein
MFKILGMHRSRSEHANWPNPKFPQHMDFHGRIVPDGFARYKTSRNPKIDETKLIVKTDEDVTWLDVSVDYSIRVNVA